MGGTRYERLAKMARAIKLENLMPNSGLAGGAVVDWNF
jgi:hypothetical protein